MVTHMAHTYKRELLVLEVRRLTDLIMTMIHSCTRVHLVVCDGSGFIFEVSLRWRSSSNPLYPR